jgi:hypothetical protein
MNTPATVDSARTSAHEQSRSRLIQSQVSAADGEHAEMRRPANPKAHRSRRGEPIVPGLGRTGTVLACMAALTGLDAPSSIAWIRKHYRPEAVEPPTRKRGWRGSRIGQESGKRELPFRRHNATLPKRACPTRQARTARRQRWADMLVLDHPSRRPPSRRSRSRSLAGQRALLRQRAQDQEKPESRSRRTLQLRDLASRPRPRPRWHGGSCHRHHDAQPSRRVLRNSRLAADGHGRFADRIVLGAHGAASAMAPVRIHARHRARCRYRLRSRCN